MALEARYEVLLGIAVEQERQIRTLRIAALTAIALAVGTLFAGCQPERREPVIEVGQVEILPAPVVGEVEPMPVVVAPGLPETEAHPSRVLGWRSRCRGGFIRLSGGQVLSCRSGL